MASKVYERPKTALQQDYSFSVQEGHIIFRLGNAALHRKNERLVEVLNKYIEYRLRNSGFTVVLE